MNSPDQKVHFFTQENGDMAMPTYCILAILLNDIEMLRDLFFKKKLAEKLKVSGGFKSVVGTVGWNKLKETVAV